MKTLFTTLLSVTYSLSLLAQQQKTIDLSQDKINDMHVSSGSVQLNLVNTLVKAQTGNTYTVSTYVINTLPVPLSIPANVAAPVHGAATDSAAAVLPTCTNVPAILKQIQQVNIATSESQLQKNYDALDAAIKPLTGACLTAAQTLEAAQDALRRQTDYIKGLVPNQKVIVTISRINKDGKTTEKVWEFTLITESQMDAWLIHYGFTFQPNIISKYPQYFAKANPTTAGTYTITQMSGSPETSWQNLSPMLVFTHPLSKTYRDFMPGVSIITGTNLNTYSAGAGLSGIIAYNGLVGFGLMYSQKYTLNGMYQPGDVVKENLSFDQLHTKRGGVEFYFTIALRLDKNPFSNSSSTSTTPTSSSATPTP